MILLRTLGECTIEIGDARLAPDSELLFSLLTYLIVERGRPIAPSVLVDFFWSNEEDAKARHCLRQSIYKLRKMGVPIETRNDRYVLPSDVAATDIDLLGCTADYGALPNHMLDILPGVSPQASRKYLSWLEHLREQVQGTLRSELLKSLAIARRANNWRLAGRLAQKCLAIDSLNEQAIVALAEAMALEGDKQAAVRLLSKYTAEVGGSSNGLQLHPDVLRKRIAERLIYTPDSPQLPLIGRGDVMSFLGHLARRASHGEAKTCLLYGQAGIGKTRLTSDFVNLAALEGFLVARVGCGASSNKRALSVFMELAPQLLRMPGALGISPEALALVRRLCDVHSDHQDWNPIDGEPSALHGKIRKALGDLAEAIACEKPLIILIEDAHWIDPLSLAALGEIANSRSIRPLLTLVTARPDGLEELRCALDSPFLSEQELQPLSGAATSELALTACAVRAEEPPSEVVKWCVEHASGNPLFIIELCRHWCDSRDTTHIPVSLESLIQSRVDSLSSSALRVLQTVSLLGRLATQQRLHDVLRTPRWEMLHAVEELIRNGLATSSGSDLQARHEIISQAALSRLDPLSMKLLHLAVAECLEAQTSAPMEAAVLWEAATHWCAGGDGKRAIALASECASHLVRIGLPHEAADLLDRSLAFAASDEERLTLYTHRAVPLRLAGLWSELHDNSEAALAILEVAHASDRHCQHEIDNYSAHYGRQTVASGGVVRRALRCVEDPSADRGHRLAAAMWGLAGCYADCRRLEAAAFVQQISTITPQSDAEVRNALLCQLVFHLDFGDLGLALRAGDGLLSKAEKSADPATLAHALRVSTYPYRVLGDFEVVDRRLSRAMTIAVEHNLIGCVREVLVLTAQHTCNTTDYNRGWQCIQRLEEQVASHPGALHPSVLHVGAEIALMRNDLTSAASYLEKLKGHRPDCARFDADVIALRLMYAVRKGEAPDRSAVDRLRWRHNTLREVGGQEFPTAALCAALDAIGESENARQTAHDYCTKFRRETWKVVNPILRDLVPS